MRPHDQQDFHSHLLRKNYRHNCETITSLIREAMRPNIKTIIERLSPKDRKILLKEFTNVKKDEREELKELLKRIIDYSKSGINEELILKIALENISNPQATNIESKRKRQKYWKVL